MGWDAWNFSSLTKNRTLYKPKDTQHNDSCSVPRRDEISKLETKEKYIIALIEPMIKTLPELFVAHHDWCVRRSEICKV